MLPKIKRRLRTGKNFISVICCMLSKFGELSFRSLAANISSSLLQPAGESFFRWDFASVEMSPSVVVSGNNPGRLTAQRIFLCLSSSSMTHICCSLTCTSNRESTLKLLSSMCKRSASLRINCAGGWETPAFR